MKYFKELVARPCWAHTKPITGYDYARQERVTEYCATCGGFGFVYDYQDVQLGTDDPHADQRAAAAQAMSILKYLLEGSRFPNHERHEQARRVVAEWEYAAARINQKGENND